MDNQPPPTGEGTLPQALQQWTKFLTLAESKRLDPETFASYAPMLFAKYRLPPSIIADLLLRPTKTNRESLDPRVPQYLGSLLKLRYVNITCVLRSLLRYSTLHGEIAKGRDTDMDATVAGTEKREFVRWRSSYASEEIIFFRVAKAIAALEGNKNEVVGIRNGGDAIGVVRVVAYWMVLFTEAATAFARDAFGAVHSLQAKDEMESSRMAFLLVVLGICENPVVLDVFAKNGSQGMFCGWVEERGWTDVVIDTRRQLADGLEAFVPTIMQSQSTHEIASRLEVFRTGTLASFEPDERKESAVSDMGNYMDNLIGLERFQVPEIPIVNSRAGLYIYLNAAVS